MNQMKKNFPASTLFILVSAALLSGCITTRTASYPNHDYNTVFKSAVSGLCSDPKLLVYDADKTTGIIWIQGRGMFPMPPETPIEITGASGGTPTAKVSAQGMNNPIPDQMLELIASKLPAGKAVRPAADKDDLDLERQKLDLEKQKLQLEREKLEFEKQKLQK